MTITDNGSNGNGAAPDLKNRALLVDLSIGTWHTGVKDTKASQKTIKDNNANDRAGHFHKNLLPFESGEYAAIRQAERDARAFYWDETAPWQDGGARIILGSNVMHFRNVMREKKSTFDAAVAAFLPKYPELVEKAAKPRPEGLGDMFRRKDYPDVSVIERKFKFTLHTMPIPSASDFRLVLSADELAAATEIQSQYESDMAALANNAMSDVWNRLYALVKKASEDLGDKKKGVHKALFENARELCELLPRLNITGDANLTQMVKEVEESLVAADPQIVRKSPSIRKGVALQVSDIERRMAQYMMVPAEG